MELLTSLVMGVLLPLLFRRQTYLEEPDAGSFPTSLRKEAVVSRKIVPGKVMVKPSHSRLFIVNRYFATLDWSEKFLFGMLLTKQANTSDYFWAIK